MGRSRLLRNVGNYYQSTHHNISDDFNLSRRIICVLAEIQPGTFRIQVYNKCYLLTPFSVFLILPLRPVYTCHSFSVSGVEKVPADSAARGPVGQEGLRMYMILKFVVASLGRSFVLLTESSILRDLVVTSLIITVESPTSYLGHCLAPNLHETWMCRAVGLVTTVMCVRLSSFVLIHL
jgi:hypothetical protein